MKKYTILAIDDDESVCAALKILLEKTYYIITAKNGLDALAKYKEIKVDLVLLDIRMPGMTGLQVLEELRRLDSFVNVIMITATIEVDTAVASIHKGAKYYLTKPFDMEELLSLIKKILFNRSRLFSQIQASEQPGPFPLLNIPSMAMLRMSLAQLDKEKKPILIQGEAGSEKEDLAYFIHRHIGHVHFFAVDCADLKDLPDPLHHMLSGVTLFLNGIDILSSKSQLALLDYFQNMSSKNAVFFRQIRIVSASEQDLTDLIRQGKLHEELYHYLNGDIVRLPSMAERKADIADLLLYYVEEYNQQWGKESSLSLASLDALQSYPWPGNITELKNTVSSLVVSSGHHQAIELDALPLNMILYRQSPSSEQDNDALWAEFSKHFQSYYVQEVLSGEGLA